MQRRDETATTTSPLAPNGSVPQSEHEENGEKSISSDFSVSCSDEEDELCVNHVKPPHQKQSFVSKFFGFLFSFLSLLYSCIIFLLFGSGYAKKPQTPINHVKLENDDKICDKKKNRKLLFHDKFSSALFINIKALKFDSETDKEQMSNSSLMSFDDGNDSTLKRRLLANSLAREFLSFERPETMQRTLRIHACTWNVDQQPPPKTTRGLGECLLGKDLFEKVSTYKNFKTENQLMEIDTTPPILPIEEFPDILIVSLQEVEMGGVVLVKEYTETSVLWSEVLVNYLNNISENMVWYRKVEMVQLVGLVLIFIARVEHFSYITNLRSCIVRTGAMRGMWGNKGSLGLRATIYGKRFLFFAAHFVAHKHNERIRTFNYHDSLAYVCSDMPVDINDEIDVLETFSAVNTSPNSNSCRNAIANRSTWSRLFRKSRSASTLLIEQRVLNKHDYIFFLGDLNSRLHGMKGTDIRRLVQRREYDRLICHDELRQGMISGDIFDGFQEAFIAFPPTYKFDRETDLYDTSRKKRDPAWCDRILFRVSLPHNNNINNINNGEGDVISHQNRTTATTREKQNNIINSSGSVDDKIEGQFLLERRSSKRSIYKCKSMSDDEVGSAFSRSGAFKTCADTMPLLDLCNSFPSCNGGGTFSMDNLSAKNTQSSFGTTQQESDCSHVKSGRLLTFFSARRSTCSDERSMIFPALPNKVSVLNYHHVPCLRQSDHRPVCAQFEVCVFMFKKSLADDVLTKVYEQLSVESVDLF